MNEIDTKYENNEFVIITRRMIHRQDVLIESALRNQAFCHVAELTAFQNGLVQALENFRVTCK